MAEAMALYKSPLRKAASHSDGFAYLWVLMTVAILSGLLGLGAELFSTAARRDRERELIMIGRQFQKAIGRYYEGRAVGGAHEYPSELEDLLRDRRHPGIVRHLRKVFIDPMTGKPEWGLLRVGGRVVGVHSLSDGEPMKKARFDASEASFNGKAKYSEWVFTYPENLLLKTNESSNVTFEADHATKP